MLGWKDWWEGEMEDRGGIIVKADEPVDQVTSKVLRLVRKIPTSTHAVSKSSSVV